MTGPKILKMISRTGSKDPKAGERARGAERNKACAWYSGKGFTLIEVLLTVSILAVGLVGVLRAYATSTNAMERSQYDLDAVFLLKEKMGQIEEKALIQGGMVPGFSKGEFVSIDDRPLGRLRSDPWTWKAEVQKMDLPVKKNRPEASQTQTKTEAEKEKPDFNLDKLKLTVANSGRTPLREIIVETYVESEHV